MEHRIFLFPRVSILIKSMVYNSGVFKFLLDPTCTLLPPHCTETLPTVTRDRISAALATRYNVHKTVAKRHLPSHIDQWGKVRRTDGGDTMSAALVGHPSIDKRDSTHVRVSDSNQLVLEYI